MSIWQGLPWLPVTPGYPFTGKFSDGTTARLRVGKLTELQLAMLVGWRP